MKRTLYVTDLDGTLMKNDKSISKNSIETLNRLIEQGTMVTYATARSIYSASAITRDINFKLPVITRNGTVLADNKTKKELEVEHFSFEEIQQIRRKLKGLKLCGHVTAFIQGVEFKSYLSDRMNEGFEIYLQEHQKDKRLRSVLTEDELFEGEINYLTFIGETKQLEPLFRKVKDDETMSCVFQKDTYRPEYWLEICPKNATKAKAIQKIKKKYCCDRVVVFGDSLNDISMFETADESCAVVNAMDEVKAVATHVIISNEEDGVAKWIMEDGKKNM